MNEPTCPTSHTPCAHTHAGNCISTMQLSKILLFLPIPAELELGGTGWGEFLKIQSNFEKPLLTKQGISLAFFSPFSVASSHLSLLDEPLSLRDTLPHKPEGTSFIPAF